MNILVFDTETTGLEKCFCYDLGYQIVEVETEKILARRHFIIEQVWHNLPLFESAYYKEKRELYVGLMRSRQAILTKWGYACAQMKNDIKKFEVAAAYAYNSDFDDKVFRFNCDWFKNINPIESVPVFDIWAYATNFITLESQYKAFCEENGFFTDTGNYKQSAEVVHRYLTGNIEFTEAHMGLMDVEIETAILLECLKRGAKVNETYTLNKILPRIVPHPFAIKVDGKEIYHGEYLKKYARKDVFSFTSYPKDE